MTQKKGIPIDRGRRSERRKRKKTVKGNIGFKPRTNKEQKETRGYSETE